MAKSEKLETRLSIANLIIAIISLATGVILGLWTSNSAEKIAERAGDFNEPDIQLSISSSPPFHPGIDTHLAVGAHLVGARPLLLRVPFYLKNAGTATAENVNFVIRYPKFLRLGFDPSRQMMDQAIPLVTIKHSSMSLGSYDLFGVSFSSMDPGLAVRIEEPLVIYQNSNKASDKSFTANRKWPITIAIIQKNRTPQEYPIDLEFIDSKDAPDLLRKAVRQVDIRRDRLRSRLRVDQYIRLLLGRGSSRQIHLFFPKLTESNWCPQMQCLAGALEHTERSTLVFREVHWKYIF